LTVAELVAFARCFLPSFGSFGKSVAEKKIILKLTNQKQELNKTAMLGNASR
jgi:hypothetical protein